MTDTTLFHAYVVGGTRESAREYIAALLAPFTAASVGERRETEHVSFGIDDARSLRSWQELMPEAGKRNICVVYADFITREAENALLKTLEEPTPGTHVIFAIPKPDVLLPTLLSRVRVVMPSAREGTGLEGKKFLALSRADRLAHVTKLVEKSEDEEAAAEVRERTLGLMDSLEKFLANDMAKNADKLESILKFKKYLYIPGASSRMILETLALTI
jgi:hypothetical protein